MPRTPGSGIPSFPVEVFDLLTSITTIYPSMAEAARQIKAQLGNNSKIFFS
jgi:hypothetical protein